MIPLLKPKIKKVCIITLLLLILIKVLTFASSETKEKVIITALTKATIDLDDDITIFEGNVKVSYADVELSAQRAEIEEREIAILTGNPELTQPDITLTGKVFTVYIGEKKVIVDGDVNLIKEEVKRNENSNEEINIVTITCDKMELYTKTKGFKAEGNVWVSKNSSYAKADFATYEENEKAIVLSGNVFAEGKNSETMKCGTLIFRTDKDYMEATEEVVFEFEIDNKEG